VDKGVHRIERLEVVRQRLGKRSARVVNKGAFAESDDAKLRASRSGNRKACGRNVKRARARRKLDAEIVNEKGVTRAN